MEAQHFCRRSLTRSWIFLFSFLSACTGVTAQVAEIKLNSLVFVAFPGEDLTLGVTVHNPNNQSEDKLRCYDPSHSQIGDFSIDPTQREESPLLLKNMSRSGMYTCKYLKAEVRWFLRVTDKFHLKSPMSDYREIIIVGLFTGVLLVFSVLASVCVFRGHWIETSSDSLVRSRKQRERREEKDTENEEHNMDMTTAQSSSFYASLEPRTRSIYDVLDHSAAKSDEQQTKTKSPKAELSKEVEQNPEHQDEGIFESVYENF